MSKIYTVSFNITLDDKYDDVDEVDIEDWIEFEIGTSCSLSCENSLSDTDIHSQSVSRVSVY